jgi:hypothetical protein
MRFTGSALALVISFSLPIASPAEEASAPIVRNEMRVLSADEVDRYVAALKDLTKLGLDASAQLEGEPSQVRQQAAAMKYGGEMQKVLGKHDFDAQSFTDVHWNVLMAYLADEMSGPSAELQQAQAQQKQMLAEMKQKLPPEQYEAAAKAMQALIPSLDAASNAPEQNRKLVADRRAELDAIFESARTPKE